MINKTRKILSFVLVISVVLMSLVLSAGAADAKSVLTFKVSDDGYGIVSDCKVAAEGVVSVPAKVTIDEKTYKVKYIGDKAFDKCRKITEIHIPEGVTAIGSYAFRNCEKLKDIYTPESLVRCEIDAFYGCENLTVHCYESTYQFINLTGINANVTFNVIDASEDDETSQDTAEDSLSDLGFIGKFITALKTLINNILEHFGANDDDFSIEDLPFDLPFEIPEENDDSFLDLF